MHNLYQTCKEYASFFRRAKLLGTDFYPTFISGLFASDYGKQKSPAEVDWERSLVLRKMSILA
jgi:hypothetical protein